MDPHERDLERGHSGEDIGQLHADLIRLGHEINEVDQTARRFGESTHQAVLLVQAALGIEPTGVVDAATAAGIGRSVQTTRYVVTGVVASATQASVGGLKVQLVDVNIGADVTLADTLTDARGAYTISVVIPPASLGRRHKIRPDLQVLIFAAQTQLAASAVRYQASNHETLNVALPAHAASLSSEYETLTAAITTAYPGQLSALQENAQRRDITYLANRTGWDARAVALAALADQLAQTPPPAGDAAIAPAFFYALLRAGLPANAATLFQASPQTVSAAWTQAIQQGVIPAALANEVPAALQTFQALSAGALLTAAPVVGPSSLQDMLTLSLPDAGQRQTFAELYVANRHDPASLWADAQSALGADTVRRLQLHGQLFYLTLNNAPLAAGLLAAETQPPLTSTLDLASRGYYDPAKWTPLISAAIPDQIPGQTTQERQANYANLLAIQVRLAFPTAVVADLVGRGVVPVVGDATVAQGVQSFLTSNQGQFEIGLEAVEAYAARANVTGTPQPVIEQIKRLQRVYQITQDDQSMAALLGKQLDSAFAITRHGHDGFVRAYKDALGGEQAASDIHARSKQIYGSVLNIVAAYLTTKVAPAIGGTKRARFIHHAPDQMAGSSYPVIAYPTLQGLFGSMDYCDCQECRSILSAAAYFVDLLHYLDCPTPTPPQLNPQDVLFSRRPDLQHLALTCANTNTALPYIDIVNEILEYFVANNLSLAGYAGHDTDDTLTSAELLASPQYVDDAAYATLEGAFFPPPLPFNRPLELLRRHLQSLGVALPDVMAALRPSDAIEHGAAAYGWRDILMEQIGLSREEYRLFTDPTLKLQDLYGYPALSDAAVLSTLQTLDLQDVSRRLGVSYDDLFAILQTQFINPNATLIPRLQKLNAPFATLQALHADPSSTAAAFILNLPAGLDAREYGGANSTDYNAVVAWVTKPTNYARIMNLIVVSNPTNAADLCSATALQFRHANPDNSANLLSATDFIKLIRLIRLWSKLGLGIEQTDDVLAALYPAANVPSGLDDAANRALLDQGFLVLLPRIGVLFQLIDAMSLSTDTDLQPLLACWAAIGTHGANSLYGSMFLTPTLTQQDSAFLDDGYGDFLANPAEPLLTHEATLRAAFKLTGDEFDLITTTLAYDASAILTLDNISGIYRIGWFAHALQMSVVEFLLLKRFTGLDPFATLDPASVAPAEPPAARLARLAQAINAAGLAPVQALYLMWNQDISGASAPTISDINALARSLRADFAGVETLFNLVDDPSGAIAKRLMTLVYGGDATDFFFGLLNTTMATSVGYSSPQGALAQAIIDAAGGRLTYDDLRKQLTYAGVLNAAAQAVIDAAITASGNDPALHAALAALGVANHTTVDPFFAAYPELQPLFDAYAASSDPAPTKRTALLASILPALKVKRKQEQALSAVTAAAAVDPSFAAVLLNRPEVLPAAAGAQAAIIDLTAIEAQGLSAAFFLGNDPSVAPNLTVDAVAKLAYAPGAAAAAHTLTLSGHSTTGDVLTTTLNGLNIAYPVAAGDTTADLLAASIAKAVNATAALDPSTNLPLNTLIAASAAANTISLSAIGGAPAFTVGVAVSAGATEVYEADGQLPASPGGAPISAVFSGYLDCPQDGLYDIHVAADPGAAVTLKIGAATIAMTQSGDVWSNQSTITLAAGAPVQVVLTATSLHANLTLSWSSNGIGLQPIPGAYLYAATLIDRLRTTYVRFLKATSLATSLPLTANEIAYLALPGTLPVNTTGSHDALAPGPNVLTPTSMENIHTGAVLTIDSGAAAEVVTVTAATSTTFSAVTTKPHDGTTTPFSITGQALGQSWLGMLSVVGDPDDTMSAILRDALSAVLDFARIKKAVSPNDERLLGVLRNPAATLPDGSPAMLALTGWNQASVSALVGQFFGDGQFAHLTPVENLRRVFDAYKMVTACKITGAALIAATTNDPSPVVVSRLQSALRARYAQADWLTVVRPINDTLRSLQRDALTAYVLQNLGDNPNPDIAAINTAGKLFEFLLVDVETEPPVLTSRIRLGLSSVQLFIERILRNLEPQAWPLDIEGANWPWMKRYRVWQANREVFLWPENWLYPELRDDQSPFFTQMMTSLLQSDMTDDAAANAYLDYLTNLEGVAKLEPCGLYYIPAVANKTDEASYVVGRTAGAHRKYYFRQLQAGGWTPWTEMKLDCEDLPVTPIIWNDRLFVFWLKVLKETPISPSALPTPSTDPTTLNQLTVGGLQTIAQSGAQSQTQVVVRAALCWSEFYNGKWQPTKTSDLNRPTIIGTFDSVGPFAFDADRALLRVAPLPCKGELSDALFLNIQSPIYAYPSGGFILYNTHSLPVRLEDAGSGAVSVIEPARSRSLGPVQPYTGGATIDTFGIFYWNLAGGAPTNTYTNDILGITRVPRYVEPQPGADAWDAPFFYEDRRYVFYVTTTETFKTTRIFNGYGVAASPSVSAMGKIPPIVQQQQPQYQKPGGDPVVFNAGPSGGAPAAIQSYLAGQANIHVALGSGLSVAFQGVQIGPSGSLPNAAAAAATSQRSA